MSFRLEDKSQLHISELIRLKKLIVENNGKRLFSNRGIESIYFDNNSFNMYNDSEEGVLPRKKIRVRKYLDKEMKSYNFETKISSVEGKFKTSNLIEEKIFNRYLKQGIFDKDYGSLYAVIKISYLREYWFLQGARLTIDYNIQYAGISNNKIYGDNETLILEIKSKNEIISIQNLLTKILPIQKQRFSKYCEGIKKVYSLNVVQKLAI